MDIQVIPGNKKLDRLVDKLLVLYESETNALSKIWGIESGDCAEVSLAFFVDVRNYPAARIVHGTTKGFIHYWLEFGQYAAVDVSNGHFLVMSRKQYYQIQKPTNITRLTKAQYLAMDKATLPLVGTVT